MKRTVLTIVIFAAITGVAYIVGCSNDDKTSTGSVTKPAGDTLDPVYLGAKDAFGDAMDSITVDIEAMVIGLMGVLDSMASIPPAKPMGVLQTDTVWYNADNHYWYAVEASVGSPNRYQIDSLQFMHGNTAVQWPDTAQLTRINGGMLLLKTITPKSKIIGEDTLFKYAFQGSISGAPGSIAARGDVTISGAGNIYWYNMPAKEAAIFYCGYELDDNYLINNVQMNMIAVLGFGQCPASGAITHNTALTLMCSGDTTFTNTDNWYLQNTFVNDSAHYVLENSSNRWEYTEGCRGIFKR